MPLIAYAEGFSRLFTIWSDANRKALETSAMGHCGHSDKPAPCLLYRQCGCWTAYPSQHLLPNAIGLGSRSPCSRPTRSNSPVLDCIRFIDLLGLLIGAAVEKEETA